MLILFPSCKDSDYFQPISTYVINFVYTKMTCKGLLILCISNALISLCIICKWDTAHLILCVPTCLFATYQSIDAYAPRKGKAKREDSQNK